MHAHGVDGVVVVIVVVDVVVGVVVIVVVDVVVGVVVVVKVVVDVDVDNVVVVDMDGVVVVVVKVVVVVDSLERGSIVGTNTATNKAATISRKQPHMKKAGRRRVSGWRLFGNNWSL